MIYNLKQEISSHLTALYPGIRIYDEDLPLEHEKPCFLINVISQQFSKGLGGNHKHELTFDLSYFSDVTEGIKKDCFETGTTLVQEFELSKGYRIGSKKADTIDNVLHFTFALWYIVRKEETAVKMQNQELKTNL